MNTLFFDFEQLKQAYWNEPRPSLATRKDRILRIVTMLNENEENNITWNKYFPMIPWFHQQ